MQLIGLTIEQANDIIANLDSTPYAKAAKIIEALKAGVTVNVVEETLKAAEPLVPTLVPDEAPKKRGRKAKEADSNGAHAGS